MHGPRLKTRTAYVKVKLNFPLSLSVLSILSGWKFFLSFLLSFSSAPSSTFRTDLGVRTELAHWTYRKTCLLRKSNQQYIQFIPLLVSILVSSGSLVGFLTHQSVRNSMNMSINSNSSHLSPSHIHGDVRHFWAHTWKFDQLFYCWWNVSIVILSTNFSGILDVLSFFLQSKHNYNKYPGKYSMLYQAIVHIGRISLTL